MRASIEKGVDIVGDIVLWIVFSFILYGAWNVILAPGAPFINQLTFKESVLFAFGLICIMNVRVVRS